MAFRAVHYFVLSILCLLVISCDSPKVENIYRKGGYFPWGLSNIPIAFLVSEWGGKPRIMASGWLIDGGNGKLFSAKHFSDAFMSNIVELGTNECKAFLGKRVYACVINRVPPLRDAVILDLLGSLDLSELPKPYKLSSTKLKIGDTVFVQGFHPHPAEITKSNESDGLLDWVLPILKNYYEVREANPERMKEIVFDSLEARVVDLDVHIKIDNQDTDPLGELKYKVNDYIQVATVRNHKFSFGGLSGGVVVRLNSRGTPEAVGIVTAEKPERLEYDKKGKLKSKPTQIVVSDTLLTTPIESVDDLYEHARQGR